MTKSIEKLVNELEKQNELFVVFERLKIQVEKDLNTHINFEIKDKTDVIKLIDFIYFFLKEESQASISGILYRVDVLESRIRDFYQENDYNKSIAIAIVEREFIKVLTKLKYS